MKKIPRGLLRMACLGGLVALIVTACGGGGGDSTPPAARTLSIRIAQPTNTGSYSSNCNTLRLSGDLDLGAHSQCCGGPAPTDDTITWKNQASGASGAAGVFVSVCSAFGISVLCNPHWTATVPLVIGNNRITIDIVDSGGDKGEAVLNVNKAAV